MGAFCSIEISQHLIDVVENTGYVFDGDTIGWAGGDLHAGGGFRSHGNIG